MLFMVCPKHIYIIHTNITHHVVNARSAEGALSAEATHGSMWNTDGDREVVVMESWT